MMQFSAGAVGLRFRRDDGHILRRGERTAVCAKTYEILDSAPYANFVIPIEPRTSIREAERQTFDRSRQARRDLRETKGPRLQGNPHAYRRRLRPRELLLVYPSWRARSATTSGSSIAPCPSSA